MKIKEINNIFKTFDEDKSIAKNRRNLNKIDNKESFYGFQQINTPLKNKIRNDRAYLVTSYQESKQDKSDKEIINSSNINNHNNYLKKELEKFRIEIEKKFQKSQANRKYKFPKTMELLNMKTQQSSELLEYDSIFYQLQ